MQKRNSCYLGTLEVGLPCTELFGSLSPVYEEEVEEAWLGNRVGIGDAFPSWALQSSDHSVLDAWELLQEYGDLSYHQDDFPELYDLCVNINDVCGKYESEKKGRSGPTLAELNGRRALSPLINPEMRRLHMEATELEEPEFFLSSYGLKEQVQVAEPFKVVTNTCSQPNGRQFVYTENKKAYLTNDQPDTCNKSKNKQDLTLTSLNIEPLEKKCFQFQATNPKNANTEEKECNGEDAKSRQENITVKGLGEDLDSPEPEVKLEEVDNGDPDTLMESEIEDDEDDYDIDSEDDRVSRRDKMLMAKGRRSEAEDWTPNPVKLVEIGKQLDRLNRVIGDLRPINELPMNSRNKTRREKNKLASRACRLKKKAGHEANKIKLRGLEMENNLLHKVVEAVKEAIVYGKESANEKAVLKKVDLAMGNCVAGKLTDFVDTVIKKAAVGDCLKGFKHHIKG